MKERDQNEYTRTRRSIEMGQESGGRGERELEHDQSEVSQVGRIVGRERTCREARETRKEHIIRCTGLRMSEESP